ncbi:hypothetical protein QL285_070497 [Trifolium repens]|nr:hypothetical protein QL285_070497 [Trifolium repens]
MERMNLIVRLKVIPINYTKASVSMISKTNIHIIRKAVGIAYNGSKGLGVWIRCVGGSVVHRTKGFDGYFGDSRVRGAQIH